MALRAGSAAAFMAATMITSVGLSPAFAEEAANAPPAGAGDQPEPAGAPAQKPAAALTDHFPEAGPEWDLGSPRRLQLGAHLGLGSRLDDPPLLSADSRQGLLFGVDLDLFFAERVSFGLGFEHLDLGTEETGVLPTGSASLTRDLNSLWLNLRLYPFRVAPFGFFLRLALAASWQSADMTGVAWPRTQPDLGQPFSCEGSDTPGFALRAALGVDAAIAPGLTLLLSLSFDSYQLSDEILDACVPGAGSAAVLNLQTGLAYGFDVSSW